jgi:hypothetical protein
MHVHILEETYNLITLVCNIVVQLFEFSKNFQKIVGFSQEHA